jgi:hypothetical protein
MTTEFMLAYRSNLYEPSIPAAPADTAASKLELTVLFTGLPSTLQALSKATALARDLDARIRLVVPQIVPYPLDLDKPPVLLAFQEGRFQELAAAQAIETRVEIFLCRDVEVLLEEILPEHSTVLIGGRKTWWPTAQTRLARRLHRLGHQIVFAEPLERMNNHA